MHTICAAHIRKLYAVYCAVVAFIIYRRGVFHYYCYTLRCGRVRVRVVHEIKIRDQNGKIIIINNRRKWFSRIFIIICIMTGERGALTTLYLYCSHNYQLLLLLICLACSLEARQQDASYVVGHTPSCRRNKRRARRNRVTYLPTNPMTKIYKKKKLHEHIR